MLRKQGKLYYLDVDSNMKKKALDFATTIIVTNNQYSRLLPENIRRAENFNLKQKLEIQRTYVGKLGEIVFGEFLRCKGKFSDAKQMFEIYEGQTTVDEFDFETKDSYSVDVKSGFRKIHKRLLVNLEQFDRNPKDYYVAVWFNGKDSDENNKLIDLNSITTGIIHGYATYEDLSKKAEIKNFGEGDARSIFYNSLRSIDDLLDKF